MAGCLISPSACNRKWFPGASPCLQLQLLSLARALFAVFTIHFHRHGKQSTEYNYIQIILFQMYSSEKWHAHKQKQFTNRSSQKVCRSKHTCTRTLVQKAHKHTHTSASKSIIFISSPMRLYFFVAAPCSQKYLFLLIFFFLRKHKRNHTFLSPWLMPK